MKNKRGFTLVELLVTIALMLSILGIAIVSFINISNRKKEEAYNLVKEQIITAAEQYFDSNEYLFEGLSENSYGIISVGKLVNEDYLNKVTNPVTGQFINNCSQVQVTKKNGIYNSEFKEYSSGDSCESNYSVTITEPGAPSIELNFFKNGDESHTEIFAEKNEWFNKKVLGEKTLSVYVNGNKNGNEDISGIKMCITNDNVPCTNYENYVTTNSSYEDNVTFGNDTKGKTACYKVINVSGKSASKCIMAKVDKTSPELKYGNPKYTNYSFDDPGEPVNSSPDKNKIENGNWSTSNASFSVWTKDETSGINPKEKLFYIEWNDWGGTNGFECNDDGCLTNNITFKENDEGYNKILNNGNTIYVRDNGNLSDGKRKEKFTVCDEAGNCISKAIYAKIDTKVPTIEFDIASKGTSNSQWYDENDKVYRGSGSYSKGTYKYSGPWGAANNIWGVFYSSTAPGWDPVKITCGVSGCDDYKVKGCAKDSDGSTWQHKDWSTTFLKNTCANVASNSGNCITSKQDDDKDYFMYKYKVCSKAGLCSNGDLTIEHFYSGNESNHDGCGLYGE